MDHVSPHPLIVADKAFIEFIKRWQAGLKPHLLLETCDDGKICVSSRVTANHHPSQYRNAEEASRQHKTEQVHPPYPYLHKRHQGPSQLRRCEHRAKACVAIAAEPINSTLLHNCGCEVEKAHAQPQPNLIIGPSKHLQSAENLQRTILHFKQLAKLFMLCNLSINPLTFLLSANSNYSPQTASASIRCPSPTIASSRPSCSCCANCPSTHRPFYSLPTESASSRWAQPHHVRDELCLDLDYIKELLAAKTAELTIQLEYMI